MADAARALLLEIEAYCRWRGIAESTFGRRAVNDGKFVGRLRAGKRVTTVTLERVRSFMDDQPASGDSAELSPTVRVAATEAEAEAEAAVVGEIATKLRN